MSFFSELKRRHVFRVGAAYLIVSWLLVQVINTVGDILDLPDVIARTVLLLLAVGFPVALVISWIYEVTPEGVATQEAVDAGVKSSSGRKLNAVILAGMSLVIVFLLFDNYVLPTQPVAEQTASSTEVSGNDDTEAAPQTFNAFLEELASRDFSDTKTVAILPFSDLSPDGDQAWFAEGVSEDIRTLLTGVEGLTVTDTSSSNFFRDQQENYTVIREQLNVDYLLNGSVRRAGDDLRINVQLVDTGNGSSLWSEIYEGTLQDIFTVQDEIAIAVSQAMEVTLGVGQLSRSFGMTRNTDAYALYLEARQMFPVGTEEFRQQILLYERALDLDESFVDASAQLIRTYSNNWLIAGDFPNREARIAEAEEHVRSYMPDYPVFGLLRMEQMANSGNWIEIAENRNRAAREFSSAGFTDIRYPGPETFFLFRTGRGREAIPLLERAVAINPLRVESQWMLAEALAYSRDFERAYEVNSDAIALENSEIITFSRLLMILGEGDPEKINQLPDLFPDLEPDHINSIGIQNLQNPEAAITAFRQRLEEGNFALNYFSVIAAWLAYFGDFETALSIHSGLTETNALQVTQDIFRPVYGEMRQQPGFKDLVRKLGLVEYWRTTGNWGDYCQPIENTDDFECF